MNVKEEKRSLFEKLRDKYRLVIINDSTFEEKSSFMLSRLNVITAIAILFIVITLIVVSAIIFTPVKDAIIGYSEIETLNLSQENMEKALLLSDQEVIHSLYIENVRQILRGEVPGDSIQFSNSVVSDINKLDFSTSNEDSTLRAEIDAERKYNLNFATGNTDNTASALVHLNFFTPLRGTISSSYDVGTGHLGVDIVAQENETIKATLDGTVIYSGWTSKDGFMIQIQHANNLISSYKHNSVLLKNMGDLIKAGDSIAIIGNTGELSTGPHLHFELWHSGKALNPEDYLIFD